MKWPAEGMTSALLSYRGDMFVTNPPDVVIPDVGFDVIADSDIVARKRGDAYHVPYAHFTSTNTYREHEAVQNLILAQEQLHLLYNLVYDEGSSQPRVAFVTQEFILTPNQSLEEWMDKFDRKFNLTVSKVEELEGFGAYPRRILEELVRLKEGIVTSLKEKRETTTLYLAVLNEEQARRVVQQGGNVYFERRKDGDVVMYHTIDADVKPLVIESLTRLLNETP